MSENFQQTLMRELTLLLDPMLQARTAERRRELLTAIGWDLHAAGGLPISKLDEALESLATAIAELGQLVTSPPETLDGLRSALGVTGNAVTGVSALSEFAGKVDPAKLPDLDQLGVDLLELLFVLYLSGRHPVAYHLAILLTLIEPPEEPAVTPVLDAGTGELVRFPIARPRVRLDRLPDLLRDPVAVLGDAYLGPTGLAEKADATRAAAVLFPRIADLLSELGVRAIHGVRADQEIDLGTPGKDLASRMLSVEYAPPLAGAAVGAGISLLSKQEGGPGVVVVPTAALNVEQNLLAWRLQLAVDAVITAIAIRGSGVDIASPANAGSVKAALTATKLTSDGAAVRIGSTNGTRLEVGQLVLRLDADLSRQRSGIGFEAQASSGALVLSGRDGDGFLKKVLPPEGLRASFDLGIGWSTTQGLHLSGGGSLDATLPVEADLLGVVRVDAAHLAVRPGDRTVLVQVGATGSVALGPVTAVVERVGLEAKITFPERGGNLGPANLELEFKPPDGAALKVDAAIAKGGGYLFFDREAAQYAGILQLTLGGKASVTAIGILSTKLPDRSPGFSLLVIITAQGFAPVQLGFGFTLTGIGGLLAVNRSVNAEAMRAGVRIGALDATLFPSDPLRNAPAIISTLNTVMPPAPGRFLVGPIAIIGWGTPTLLTLKLALLLELPQPVRLSILGRLSAVLPDQEHPLIRLQFDAFGQLDFDRGELSLDASLRDSRLLAFVLTGDMALRANWGSAPAFLLSVGGFNPRFPVPAGFPRLERLSVSLSDTPSLKLGLSAYLALTSNTVQFGARVDLAASAGDFRVEGVLAFDTLFTFSPQFSFVADLAASLALRFKGKLLFSVHLEATLSGPAPWHVRGKAKFELLFLSCEIAFDASFGERLPPPPVEPVDLERILREELGRAGNWSAELPAAGEPLVSLREARVDGVLAHPLGTLTLRQRRVPLERRISRVGNAPPVRGPQTFRLEAAGEQGTPLPKVTPITDLFARGQFEALTDEQKLSEPAFEPMTSGLRFGSDAVDVPTALALDTPVAYETAAHDPALAAAAPA